MREKIWGAKQVHFIDLLYLSGPGVEKNAHLGSQESGQVNLGDHLATAVALLLVSVLVVLHQVPNFDSTFQVRRDHGCTRAQAVWAACVFDHVFWRKEKSEIKKEPRWQSPEKKRERESFFWCSVVQIQAYLLTPGRRLHMNVLARTAT